MKKLQLIVAASALVLASCANDEVVNPANKDNGANKGQVAMTFNFKAQNQSRADYDYTNKLQNESYNFGVWAVKADGWAELQATDIENGTNVVMKDYLVGYYDAANTKGYTPYVINPVPQLFYGSAWFYEGLGSTQYYTGHTTYINTSESVNEKQYLKYWDGSKAYTFFLAYAPYIGGTDTPVIHPADPSIEFKAPIGLNATTSYMYSKQCELNADFIEGGSRQTVPMMFHRLLSKVRIAVWEDIPGYDVEMIDVTFNGETGNHGIAAMPATQDGTTYDWGHIVKEGIPTVKVSLEGELHNGSTDATKDEVSYASCATTAPGEYFEFAIPAGKLGETRDARKFSSTVYNVLPNDGTTTDLAAADQANTGIQMVMSFKLIAKDTKEEIIVRGARVFVPETATQWAPNTLYTYTFRITKDSTGTTTSVDPNPEPENPNPKALYPIVFDKIDVAEMETVEMPSETGSYDVN